MSKNELLHRALNSLQQFKKPKTNCWCDRNGGAEGIKSMFPPNAHTLECIDIQKLEADLVEAIR